jgi:DNA-binding response OmpR family regulator
VIEVGQLRIDRKGHACRWKGRNLMLEPIPFELLRFLAGHAGQPLARQEIIDELWPGNDDDSAGRSLNAAIWRLRQALGDDNRVGTVRHYGYSYEPE